MNLVNRAVHHPRFGTYRAIADFLGISDAYMSQIKTGKRKLQAKHAAMIAAEIGEPMLPAIVEALIELEQRDEDKDFWRGKLKNLATTGALGIVLATGLMMPEKVRANPLIPMEKISCNYRTHGIGPIPGFIFRYLSRK
eukprot:TRINITY_DN7667_c1_g1_i1.p1 TRINITY_DN7667_c1_g1~~TRINITY_DN7667_c1_g1_i1.p1  ORF type:complete len:139 (-),score=14.15 TRINITY_DN7667_c1_g1_i1:168-584(-)